VLLTALKGFRCLCYVWQRVRYRTVARKFSVGELCRSAGRLCVCAGGLDIIKLTKIPLIYGVSSFNLGGSWSFAWGAKPAKDPRGDETGTISTICRNLMLENSNHLRFRGNYFCAGCIRSYVSFVTIL